MDATSTQGGEPNNHRLLEYKLQIITENLGKLESSMKEMNTALTMYGSQQIRRDEWNTSQDVQKGLLTKMAMMAGAIVLLSFGIPILLTLWRMGK